MKVTIFTDIGGAAGYGHASRCSALAERFVCQECIVLVVLKDYGSDHNLFGPQITIQRDDWHEDVELVKKYVSGSDICIIDSYHYGKNAVDNIRDHVSKVLVFDDEAKNYIPTGCDVLNGAIGAEKLSYDTTRLRVHLGPRFASLRSEFSKCEPRICNDRISSILVTLGGTDQSVLLKEITSIILEVYPEATTTIITSKESKFELPGVNVFKGASAKTILQLMKTADIAVTAGGQTLNEMAVTGLPAIAILLAENQRINIESWSDIGFVESVGSFLSDDFTLRLTKSLLTYKDRQIRDIRARIGQATVDGCGVERIVTYLLDCKPMISIRLARMDDASALYDLSMDPVVRESSINSDGFSFESHVKWLENNINDQSRRVYVCEIGTQFVGQIRFNLQQNVAVISISIVESWRGSGITRRLFKCSIDALTESAPWIDCVSAIVKKTNIVSNKFFKGLGFSLMGNQKFQELSCVEYILELNKNDHK